MKIMNESTKFLITRMDEMEQRLLKELKDVQRETNELSSLKNKVIGAVMVVSFVISSIAQVVFHKLGG